MAFRTHASLLDAARLATLAAALLAPTTAGVGGVAHDPGMPAAPPVLSEQARSQAYDTVWENLRLAAIDQEAAAPEAWDRPGRQAEDRAAVYLLSFYSDGTFLNGSGTIIRGEDGIGRVLTAGHVVPLEQGSKDETVRLQEVYAFSAEGRDARISLPQGDWL